MPDILDKIPCWWCGAAHTWDAPERIAHLTYTHVGVHRDGTHVALRGRHVKVPPRPKSRFVRVLGKVAGLQALADFESERYCVRCGMWPLTASQLAAHRCERG